MADVLVTCVNKPDRQSRHEHITHLGGPGAGTPWRWTVEAVIESIDARTNTFFTRDAAGNRADVKVVRPPGRRPYVQTHRDNVPTDNLLSLAECPLR
jgi:hypothetical protein